MNSSKSQRAALRAGLVCGGGAGGGVGAPALAPASASPPRLTADRHAVRAWFATGPASDGASALLRWFVSIFAALALAACGGGGGGGGDAPPDPGNPTSPAITAQPTPISVVVGQSASFSAAATGTAPLQYQWQKNGGAIAGATGSSYSTPATALDDDGASFSVVVSNSAGSTSSNAARLTVVATAVVPTIIDQPSSATINAGQTATFAVLASGSAPLTYVWHKNGASIAGASDSSYTTAAAVSADDGAVFTVTVSNSAGTITSNGASLTVTAAPIAPGIAVQPASTSVLEGQGATFSVQATGTAPLAYQWRKNGSLIGGATSASYTTGATLASDHNAVFSVSVTNVAGTVTSADAVLTVNPVAGTPGDEFGPRSITVTAGDTATFSTATNGASYSWTRNGVRIAGATSHSYTTPPTTLSDSGTGFVVRFVRPDGLVAYRSALLTVTAAPIAPAVTAQPASVSVTPGRPASFLVAAIGTAPMSYQWRRNGTVIPGATGEGYSIAATTLADSGATFSVTMTNALGTITSNSVSMTVASTVVAPTISTQPASILVNPGQTGDFRVVANGTGPLAYQWRRNGVDIAGATERLYFTPENQATDSGALYSVVVSNSAGSVTSSAGTLTVTTLPLPPRVVTGPADLTVAFGQTATFSLVAGGTPPFTYSWVKNNVRITGATAATYTTPPAGDADDGAQFVGGAGNGRGGTTTSPATLTVVLPTSAAVQFGAGQHHSAMLKADGTIFSWGDNRYGPYPTRHPAGKPLRTLNPDDTPFSDATSIAAGTGHTLAVKSDGTVWAWGYNGAGALGDDGAGCATSITCDRANPTPVLLASGAPFVGASQVVAGRNFSVALKSDGSVWAWGSNQYGKLGDGTTTNRARAVQVTETSGAVLGGITRLAAGLENTLALKVDGTVWAWGRDFGGTRATRVDFASGTPLTGVVAIAVGGSDNVGSQALAVTADGRAYAWGNGNGGTLGNGTNNNSATPNLVVDPAGNAITGVVSASAGNQFSMLLKTDGTVLGFGFNNVGQLGSGGTTFSLNPMPVRDASGNVFTGVNLLASGNLQTLVRRSDGTVWAWGLNDRHQINTSSTPNFFNPVQIPARTP